ncbi:hypothetical protein NQ315_002656 [Exocentrus adspersus]|uniref:Uncharacterized protein n=1 Tax=Exocentrus adspersus TaxID=1586481 RepID=A0AAV8VVM9_9CUCU|nr:hypothetical protein NQ315_002656 [Exocentrus adspersus]
MFKGIVLPAEKCKITEGLTKTLCSGESYCVTVNTENAGNGAVTCRIKSVDGGGDMDINIVDNGDGTVSIYYTVQDAGEYTINIKFGGQTVPGGFYTFVDNCLNDQEKNKNVMTMRPDDESGVCSRTSTRLSVLREAECRVSKGLLVLGELCVAFRLAFRNTNGYVKSGLLSSSGVAEHDRKTDHKVLFGNRLPIKFFERRMTDHIILALSYNHFVNTEGDGRS